ncbi:MAG: hypothetical protein WEA58_04135 [Balneolaceae bacterium]
MVEFKSYREESRKDAGLELDSIIELDDKDLALGALLRIADSLEIIQKSKKDLMDEIKAHKYHIESLQRENDDWRERVDELEKEIEKFKKILRG